MLECDEVESPTAELVPEKASRAVAVEEDLRVVVPQREHVRQRLASDALVDHAQRGRLDVEQVQTAAEARLEETKLRLGAGADGQRAERAAERRGLPQPPP